VVTAQSPEFSIRALIGSDSIRLFAGVNDYYMYTAAPTDTDGIFIFTGELENFYKIKPVFDKEGGVIETLGKLIEENRSLNEFVDTTEYYNMFEKFVFQTQGLIKHEDEKAAKAMED
jgi:hypothetical protein